MSKLLSDKVKKTPSVQVSTERYNFLKLSEAEPDLGVPAFNGHILTSTTTGTRSWINPLDILVVPGNDGQVVYKNGTLLNSASALYYDDINNRVGIGTETPNARLDVLGDIEINTNVRLNSQSNIGTNLLPVVISSFDHTVYGGGKFTIQAYDTVTNDRQISELIITHKNGTNPIATEYGVLSTTGVPLATYQVSIVDNTLIIAASTVSSNSTEYKVYEVLFLA